MFQGVVLGPEEAIPDCWFWAYWGGGIPNDPAASPCMSVFPTGGSPCLPLGLKAGADAVGSSLSAEPAAFISNNPKP